MLILSKKISTSKSTSFSISEILRRSLKRIWRWLVITNLKAGSWCRLCCTPPGPGTGGLPTQRLDGLSTPAPTPPSTSSRASPSSLSALPVQTLYFIKRHYPLLTTIILAFAFVLTGALGGASGALPFTAAAKAGVEPAPAQATAPGEQLVVFLPFFFNFFPRSSDSPGVLPVSGGGPGSRPVLLPACPASAVSSSTGPRLGHKWIVTHRKT